MEGFLQQWLAKLKSKHIATWLKNFTCSFQYLCNVLCHGHACQFLLNGAERVEATPKLVPCRRVFDSLLYTHLHSSRQARGHAETTVVQNVHRHLEAPTFHCTKTQQQSIHQFLWNRKMTRTFAVAGPRAWNSVHARLHQIRSIVTFKRHLKSVLFQQAYTS